MKQIILTTVIVLGLATCYAQKGSVLVYGSLGGGHSTTTDFGQGPSSTSWNANPAIGYQLSNHITLGLQGQYNAFKSYAPNGEVDNKSRTMSIGAFGRYTANLGSIFFAYLQTNAGYVSIDQEEFQIPGFTAYKSNGYSVSLFPAIGAKVYRNWAVNLNIGGVNYSNTKSADNVHKQTGINYNLGDGVNIGISKNFACHKKAVPKGKDE